MFSNIKLDKRFLESLKSVKCLLEGKISHQREFFWNFGLKIGQRSLNMHNSYILNRETFPLLASIFPEEKILMQKVPLVYISSL